jgi:hypothetical protein
MSFTYGGIACMVAAFATHPIDTIKVRLQLQGELKMLKQYNGFFRTAYLVLTNEGLSGLYKGLTASLLREGTYSTVRMALYEPFKDLLKSDADVTEPLYKKMLAGGLSGRCY